MIVERELLGEILAGRCKELRRPATETLALTEGVVLPLQATATSRAVTYIRVESWAFDTSEEVWVIEFKRAAHPDRPRFLAQDSTRGYTSNPGRAMPKEPEAVPEVWQEALTDRAETRAERVWQKTERGLNRMGFEERLGLAQQAAKKRGFVVGRELKYITRLRDRGRAMQLLKTLEKKVHR